MFRTSNPTLKDRVFDSVSGSGVMTLNGTIAKTGILLAVLAATSAYGWIAHSMGLLILGMIGGIALAIATCVKPQWAPVTALLYAMFEGLAVGTISVIYAEQMAKTQYAGAVPLAILGTLAVLAVMLVLYVTRIIKVNQTFMVVVFGATAAIGLTYLVTMLGGMFFPQMWGMAIYRSGPIGLLFSAVVIVVAALNLALDFQTIETGIQRKAPKFMEWYAGFGLLVTLIWLYLEILRLLSKLADRR